MDDVDRKPKVEPVDLKPKLEPEDRKPKVEAVDRKPDIHPLPPLRRKADVWMEVVGILQDDQAYRSISHLAVTSRNVNSVVQPRLRKMKKKVVLDSDDLIRTPEARWKDVEIIQCTELSRMPYDIYNTDDEISIPSQENTKSAQTIHDGLPWTPALGRYETTRPLLPVTPILRIMEDSTSHILRDIEASSLEARERLWTEDYFISAINAVVRNTRYGVPLSVRYILHGAYHRHCWNRRVDNSNYTFP